MRRWIPGHKAGGGQCCRRLSQRGLTCICLAFVGLMVSSAGFVVIFPHLFQKILSQQMTIKEGTPAYKEWMATSVPIFTKMYLFSLQNPDETLAKTEKPKLIQRGPYTFREVERKDHVMFNDNHTVSYQVKKNWYFEPEMSVGTLDDIITTVNVPMIGSAEASRGQFFMQWGLSSTFDNIGSQLFIKKTVRELLFEGYEDTLLALADWFGQESSIPLDRFGWFYKRNGTTWADGTFNMYTGERDIAEMGKINHWNYENRTQFDDECGRIHGSAGGFYPPGEARKSLLLFSHEACRTLSFNFKGKQSIENVPGLMYKLDETTFANETVYPPNYCFHNNLPSGVQNSTQCKQDSPAYISFPHFYQADPFFQSQFQDGSIQPDGDRHESRIVLEPLTGIPMEVLIRLQINVRIDPIQGISALANVPKEFYFPVIWFEAHAVATPSVAQTIALLVQMPQIANLIGVILVMIGLIGVIICVSIRCYRFYVQPKRIKYEAGKSSEDEFIAADLEDKASLKGEPRGAPIIKSMYGRQISGGSSMDDEAFSLQASNSLSESDSFPPAIGSLSPGTGGNEEDRGDLANGNALLQPDDPVGENGTSTHTYQNDGPYQPVDGHVTGKEEEYHAREQTQDVEANELGGMDEFDSKDHAQFGETGHAKEQRGQKGSSRRGQVGEEGIGGYEMAEREGTKTSSRKEFGNVSKEASEAKLRSVESSSTTSLVSASTPEGAPSCGVMWLGNVVLNLLNTFCQVASGMLLHS
eukprot:maker-scaffold472_size162276-snap-gene-0.29 protein:Tk12252 transcript:maker-scaffold472_size162276-snap-gene-0.29-mRNA-1 annotation:"hypothetical protein DAPPUDRAFT_303163"